MARTVHLNLTGAAARTELREQREAMLTAQFKQAKAERQRKQDLIHNMMMDLRDAEGDAFITWWDEELPAVIPQAEQIKLLEERLRQVVLSRINPTPQEGAHDMNTRNEMPSGSLDEDGAKR